MAETRNSCQYLEGGFSFYLDTIRACAVIHHDRGSPMLAPYCGGELPWAEMEFTRAKIIQENQNGGHVECRGCPNLVQQSWPARQERVHWLGISHFNACNLTCNYCWLQWNANSPRLGGEKRTSFYTVLPALRHLITSGLLAPDAVIDWGGGGEPTLMPEFPESCALLARHGVTQWLHTNALRLPKGVADGSIDCSRLRILCSLDAGTRKTYAAIKRKDGLAQVWENLGTYRARGAFVVAKYIVTGENCSRAEIEAFLDQAAATQVDVVLPDIDHRFPEPKLEIIEGLARLRVEGSRRRLPVQFGSTGVNSAPEHGVEARVETIFVPMQRGLYDRAMPRLQRWVQRAWRRAGMHPAG